jgi:hypothetical protein
MIIQLFLILFLFASPAYSADNITVPENQGRAYVTDNSNNLWPAAVVYTTDGDSNIIPISGGGGGGGTVTQGAGAVTHTSPWWSRITDGTNNAGVTTYGLKVDVQNSVRPSSNTNGVIMNNGAVSTTAYTFTAPVNAVGFILESESTNSVNIRWAIGSTATATVGMLTEPGRDSGYIPGAADISVIALSGSASISVQWILSQ